MEDSAATIDHSAKVSRECVLTPGNIVGERYVVEKLLPEGGFGCVYLAKDRNMHFRHVVIKALKASHIHDEYTLTKFTQEGEALSRITDDGVVKVIDQGVLPGGNPFLVMEYLEGETLRNLITRSNGGVELNLVGELVRQIGSALNAAHAMKIYHRDLKPDNIILINRGGALRAKLIDFGIAKVLDSLVAGDTGTVKLVGTPQYMAPEQLLGQGSNVASDVYAMGVIVYEMLTGRRPFVAGSILELQSMQKGGVKVLPRALRPQLTNIAQSVVLKALSYDSKQRYQSAEEFGRAMADALSNTEPASVPPKTRLRIWVAAILLTVAIGVLVSWLVYRRSQSMLNGHNASNVSSPKTVAAVPEPVRELSYYLLVQKIRDGKPYQEPFRSSGQEVFESGYKFKFNLHSPEGGYFYLFNEGRASDGSIHFNILYPIPNQNNGSAEILADHTANTRWNDFGGQPDTEKLWIIWTKEREQLLDAAKESAFTAEGRVKDYEIERELRDFLLEYSANQLEVSKDISNKQTVIEGTGDVIVSLLNLEHR